jgi:hypothetical protein
MAPESLDARMDELMNRDWFGMAQEVKRLRDLGEDKSFSKDKVGFLSLALLCASFRKVKRDHCPTVLTALVSIFR